MYCLFYINRRGRIGFVVEMKSTNNTLTSFKGGDCPQSKMNENFLFSFWWWSIMDEWPCGETYQNHCYWSLISNYLNRSLKLHGLLSDNHNPSLGNHLRLPKPIAAWLKLLELIPGFVKFESAAPQVNPRLLLNDNKAATLTASKGRLHAKNRHMLAKSLFFEVN